MFTSLSVRSIIVCSVLSLALLGCNQTTSTTSIATQTANAQPKIENIKAHMAFLADDLLEGRDTGSRGHEIASLYIANEFQKYGLQGGGDEGAYMQRVVFRKASLVQESPKFVLTTGDGEITLDYPKDFIIGPDPVRLVSEVAAPLIFVGYGIIADEFGHNDYQNLDVEGKIVVVLSGKPSSLDNEEGAHLASGAQKAKYAVANGAVGFITLQTPAAEKRRPYERSLTSIHVPRMTWVDPQGKVGNSYPELKARAFVSMATAETLFADAPVSIGNVYAQLEQEIAPAGFDLAISAHLKSESSHTELTSPNVAGILPGSDPLLKNEYVVFTAHSDHLGISKSVEKDEFAKVKRTYIPMHTILRIDQVEKQGSAKISQLSDKVTALHSPIYTPKR